MAKLISRKVGKYLNPFEFLGNQQYYNNFLDPNKTSLSNYPVSRSEGRERRMKVLDALDISPELYQLTFNETNYNQPTWQENALNTTADFLHMVGLGAKDVALYSNPYTGIPLMGAHAIQGLDRMRKENPGFLDLLGIATDVALAASPMMALPFKSLRKINLQQARNEWGVPSGATDLSAVVRHSEGWLNDKLVAYILSRDVEGNIFKVRIPKKLMNIAEPSLKERGMIDLSKLGDITEGELYNIIEQHYPNTVAGLRTTSDLFINNAERFVSENIGRGISPKKDILYGIGNHKFLYKDGNEYYLSIKDNNGRTQLAKIHQNLFEKLSQGNHKLPIIDAANAETIPMGKIPYTPDNDRLYDSRIIVNNPYDVDELPTYLQPSVYHPATYKSDAAFEFDVLNLNGPAIKVPKTPKVVEEPKPKLVKRPKQKKSMKPEEPKVFFSTDGRAYTMKEDGKVLRIYSPIGTNRPKDKIGWADTGTKLTKKSNTQTKHVFDNEKYYTTSAGSSTAGRLAADEKPLAIFQYWLNRFPTHPRLKEIEKTIKNMARKGHSRKEIEDMLKGRGFTWRIKDISDEDFNKLFNK